MATGKRARPGPDADERRSSLVAAAYRVLVRTGIAQLRTRDVAAEAGITVATLHYYFPTKDDLVRVVLEYAIQVGIVDMLEDDRPRTEGLDWIRAMLTGLHHQAAAEPGQFRLLHEMIWTSLADPGLRALLEHWHGDWHDAVRHHLEIARDAGDVRTDLDPSATATAVLYLVFGMVLRPPLPSPPLPGDPAAHAIAQLERLLGCPPARS